MQPTRRTVVSWRSCVKYCLTVSNAISHTSIIWNQHRFYLLAARTFPTEEMKRHRGLRSWRVRGRWAFFVHPITTDKHQRDKVIQSAWLFNEIKFFISTTHLCHTLTDKKNQVDEHSISRTMNFIVAKETICSKKIDGFVDYVFASYIDGNTKLAAKKQNCKTLLTWSRSAKLCLYRKQK